MRLLVRSAVFVALFGLATPVLGSPVGAPLGQASPTPGSPAAVKKAKKHFEAAKAAYKAGQYQEAVKELQQALELDPNGKDLVFNLGLVEEKLGNMDEAIAAYKRYTEMETDTVELEKAIQTLRRLEGARDELKKRKEQEEAARNQPETPPASSSESRDAEPVLTPAPQEKRQKGRLDGWVYGAGGVAILAAGLGTYFGVQALNTRNKSQDATGPNTTVYDLQDRAASAHNYAVASDVCFGVALGSAAVGALLYFTRDAKPEASPSVGVSVTPHAFALGVGGRL